MSVKVEVGGTISETGAAHERSEETVNRTVAEDITVAATGITSAITEAHKTVAKEEATEVAAMTGTMVVREITVMAVTRMAIASRTVDKETATARMETGMVTETIPVKAKEMVPRMETANRTVDKETATARMETGMTEEMVHKMEGIVAGETSIPQPILVNIVVLAHEGTESTLCSVSHPYDSITLLHLDSVELRTSLQQC